MKILKKLDTLCKKNRNVEYVNKDIYRLLYDEQLYLLAYENIKGNKGAMTAGVDGATLDGFSKERIWKIISKLRDESFQFNPSRRTLIPKSNGKLRKLGIPSADDKLVQECMRIILNCIYESPTAPTFNKCSFGFRSKIGCHDGLKHVYSRFQGIKWIVKADVKSFFDEINHHRLVKFLRYRIEDERFINLVWKGLRSGIFFNGRYYNTESGTPQGGIASPILANIYLHEFDCFIQQLQDKYNTSGRRKPHPEYKRTNLKMCRIRKRIDKHGRHSEKGKTYIEELKKLNDKLHTLPSSDFHDPNYTRIEYARYADDWLLGLCCPKEFAIFIYDKIEKFFSKVLKLEFNKDKSGIVHTQDEDIMFLGSLLSYTKRGDTKIITVKGTKRRVTNQGQLKLKIPYRHLIGKLANKDLCDKKGNPKYCGKLLALEDYQIIRKYRQMQRGLYNYYSFASNRSKLHKIFYIFRYSAAKTLANRHRTSISNIFKRYGKTLEVPIPKDKKKRRIGIKVHKDFKATPGRFMCKEQKLEWTFNLWVNLVSASTMFRKCSLCSKTEEIEMHHIRKLGGKELDTFAKAMGVINRKQIPVCKGCHAKIHRGEYNGVKLSTLTTVLKSNPF